MATKTGIARTISSQYQVKCICNPNQEWSVNGTPVQGSAGAKQTARAIKKLRK